MGIYCAPGAHHRAERRKVAKAIKRNTTRKMRRFVAKHTKRAAHAVAKRR